MRRQEQVELGEQAFVGGFLGVVALEAVITLVACGLHFTWPTLLVGIASAVVLIYLADRLYAGQRSVRQLALLVVGVQIVVAVAALVYLLGQSTLPKALISLAILKLIAYIGLGLVLQTTGVNLFLALKSGETLPDLAEEAPVIDKTIKPSGIVVPLTADHQKAITSLVSLLKGAGVMLILVGLLILPSVYQDLQDTLVRGLVTLVQAATLILLGWCMLRPANALQAAQAQGGDSAFVMNAFAELRTYFNGLSASLAVLCVILIVKWFLPETR